MPPKKNVPVRPPVTDTPAGEARLRELNDAHAGHVVYGGVKAAEGETACVTPDCTNLATHPVHDPRQCGGHFASRRGDGLAVLRGEIATRDGDDRG